MINPWHAHRATILNYDDSVRIRSGDRVDEGILIARQRNSDRIHVFLHRLVYKDDRNGGRLREGHSRGNVHTVSIANRSLGRVRLDAFEWRRREVDMFSPAGAAGLRIRCISARRVDLS